jgi:hypothetical protein
MQLRDSEEINGINKKIAKSLKEKSSEDLAKRFKRVVCKYPV